MDGEIDLTPFSVWSCAEGEEYIPQLLMNEDEESSNVNLATDCRVPGRIKGRHAVYQEVGADPYITRLVEKGYRLEFDDIPPPSYTKNNKSALLKSDFVYKELLRLETLGCIKRVDKQPKVVLPLSAVYSKKWRVVVDASRTLNPYCTKRKIKLEDNTHVPHIIRKGDYCVVNDLDSGYWHVPIAEEHWQYLGVHFVHEDGQVTYWVWMVLCLGLRDAAFIFTKTLAPLMAELRRQGMRGVIYIDDKLTVASSYELCLFWEKKVKDLFFRAGWVFKPGKRSGNPSQVCRFLGLDLDTRDLTFNIPMDKIENIEGRAKELLRRKFNKVRVLASFIGMLQSVRLATGPIVSVMTRSLYYLVNNAKRWESFVRFDELARKELQWWLENIREVAKFPMSGSLTTVAAKYEAEVASDGSGIGYFVYKVNGKKCLARRAFTAEEREESSTFRELVAFHETWTNEEVLKSFQYKRVAHYTDSKAMMFIIAQGSRNRKLQPLIMEAKLSCRKYNIIVEPIWISRDDERIKFADIGSRDFHADDISVDFATFKDAERLFGQFTVDGFASADNARCIKFFSRFDVPGNSGMDFFLQTLKPEDNHWLFPPVGVLCQTVCHLANQRVSGVVLVPVWPRSSFFSFFFPDGKHLAVWVSEVMWTRPYFVCGPLVTSRSFRGRRRFDSALLKADFRRFAMKEFYKPKLSPKWCREGGCNECKVG